MDGLYRVALLSLPPPPWWGRAGVGGWPPRGTHPHPRPPPSRGRENGCSEADSFPGAFFLRAQRVALVMHLTRRSGGNIQVSRAGDSEVGRRAIEARRVLENVLAHAARQRVRLHDRECILETHLAVPGRQ